MDADWREDELSQFLPLTVLHKFRLIINKSDIPRDIGHFVMIDFSLAADNPPEIRKRLNRAITKGAAR